MSAQRYEIEALLGDTTATPEQVETIAMLAARCDELGLGDAPEAFSACLEWALEPDHEAQMLAAARVLLRARIAQAEAMDAVRGIIVAADASGVPRNRIAQTLGVDRMTVYATLGRR